MHMQIDAAAHAPRVLLDDEQSTFFQPHDASPAIITRAIELAREIEQQGRRAKFYAFEALTILCPAIDRKTLAKRLSFYLPVSPDEQVRRASRYGWWQSAGTDHVIGGLVASSYSNWTD